MAEQEVVDGFKGTEIGLVPVEWEVVSIGDLGEVVTGTTPSTKQDKYYGGPYKLISPADLNGHKYVRTSHKWITEEGLAAGRELPRDSILVGCIGNVGKTGMTADDRSATNQQINAIVCDENVDPHFVYYLMVQNRRLLEERAVKTTVPILNKGNFKKVPIYMPPLPEQRRIGRVLSTIQSAVEKQEAVIAAARELKRSLMQRLFTYGPYAEERPTKETEIGEIPEHWELVRLDTIATLLSGGTPSKKRTEWWNGSIPWVSPKDIKTSRLFDSQDHITAEAAETGSRMVPAGTILIVIRGMILAKDIPVAKLEVPATFNQDVKALVPTDSIEPDYLLYVLKSKHIRLLRREIGTSAHGTRRIGTASLEAMLVPIPPQEERHEISLTLQSVEKKIQFEQQRKAALRSLFESLLYELMTGRIRVKGLELPE